MSNIDYDQLRDILKNEKELLDIMASLSPEEFEDLMSASKNYADALGEKYKAVESENRLKMEEMMLQRQRNELRHQQELEQRRLQAKQAEMEREAQLQMQKEARRTQEEQKRARYAAQLEVEMEEEKTKRRLEAENKFHALEVQRLAEKERLSKLNHELREKEKAEEYARKRQLKLELEERRAELEKQTRLALAERQVDFEIQKHEAMKEYNLAKAKELARIDAEAQVELESVRWQNLTNFFSGDEGNERLMNIGGLALISIGSYFLFKRSFAPFVYEQLNKRFVKPKLVSKHRSFSNLSRWARRQGWSWLSLPAPNVILPPALSSKMSSIVKATRNTSSRHGFFSHMMLYGKPGTGKTLFAEKLAAEAHMSFAMMSGPSFAQFKPGEAVTEIKKLFNWANHSNGLLLFIDEADTFLEDRATMHPHRVAVLNEWINQTGTESKRFMCIYETNRPEILDPAVQSRVTRSIEFPSPGKQELFELLSHYVDRYIHQDHNTQRHWYNFWKIPSSLKATTLEDPERLEAIAQRLVDAEFVGRDVSNLVIAWAQTAYASDEFEITADDVDRVLDEQIKKKFKEAEFLQTREERLDVYKRLT